MADDILEVLNRWRIDVDVVVKPLADGGEGTVDALVEGLGGQRVQVEVTGPIGEKTLIRFVVKEARLRFMGRKRA